MSTMTITRREAVIRLAALMGASIAVPRILAAAVSDKHTNDAVPFATDEISLLDEVGETIIPTTDVPGAKATQIGSFIVMMLQDCYLPREQLAVKSGLADLDANAKAKFGKGFVAISTENRNTLLNELDQQQRAMGRSTATDPLSKDAATKPPPHFFRILKELTVLGYFSSEIGCTQALRFIEVPGRFDGAAPYKKGEHAWFA